MKAVRHIRLFVSQKLVSETLIELSEKQSHYLTNVMRCQSGQTVQCFNAESGEFLCRIETADKKKTVLKVEKNIRKPATEPDIWLLFAPLKKDKTDFVIEKSVELGVGKIIPVITCYTNAGKIKTERFSAQAAEAAEQCGRLSVPEIADPADLSELLKSWDNKRVLFFLDERRHGNNAAEVFSAAKGLPAAVLVGPEGGFSEAEAQMLNLCPFVKNLNLGPRILRAETAAVSALAVWQSAAGDWNKAGD